MNLSTLYSTFGKARVLVVGDLMLDEYILGSVARISPEAPVPVLDVKSRKHVAGGAANVAANIRSLGGAVSLVGLVGDDSAGAHLRRILEDSGIGTEGLVGGGNRGTISKTRIVSGQQQIVRIDQEDRSPLPEELENAVFDAAGRMLAVHDVCVLSDYAKGILTDSVCSHVIAEAARLGKPVIVDPKGRNFQKYKGCTIITPNLNEASTVTGMTIDDDLSLHSAGAALMACLPGSGVLVTRGADGMTLFRESREAFTVPAFARRVFDVVGAGDTVVATLALSFAGQLPVETAMLLASLAASIAVGKPGTATVSVDELIEHEDGRRAAQEYAAFASLP